MRKILLFSSVLSLFLLVTASITRAQVTKTLNGVVRYESGMSTSTFETPKGNVSVVLPQSLCGVTISGTVSVEPSGKTEKEKSRNLKDLLQYVVMLDGQKIPLSGSPAKFDWLTHMDRQTRTPMELLNVSGAKVAELSLPPVLKAPSPFGGWQSDGGPVLGTPSTVLVKGDKLNVYSDRPISPGVKFILTDPQGHELFVQPLCQSSNQAVLTVPDGVAPGYCKIRMEESEITIEAKPGNKANSAGFQIMDINLSSPNTNLRPGQTSYVLADVKTGSGPAGWQGPLPDVWFGSIRVDLRNLNPNTVTMEGGNLQRVNLNLNKKTLTSGEQTYLEFQIKRNITGNTIGSFSVSATLHEDYSSSNDPFRPQLNVLKTPEDFNKWTTALKKELKGFAEMHDNDLLGQAFKTNAQRAIDNMPVCSDAGQLDECKAVTYSLVQPLHVPKGAAINWPSSYVATKAAAADIDNSIAGNTLIDYDVLKNGTEFIHRMGEWLKDGALQTESSTVQQLIDQVQTNGETKENLQQLRDNMNALTAKAGMKIKTDEEIIIKSGMKDILMASNQLPSMASPGRVHPYNDMIGYLDPVKRVLCVRPEYQQQVLNSLRAVSQDNAIYYQVNTISPSRTTVSLSVQLMPLVMADVFAGDWWAKKLIEEVLQKDTTRGKIVTTHRDSIGTWYVFYKDAKCVQDKYDMGKTYDCMPGEEWDLEANKSKPTGFYEKFVSHPKARCLKGTDFCTEVYVITGTTYIYQDAKCTRLLRTENSYNFSCL